MELGILPCNDVSFSGGYDFFVLFCVFDLAAVPKLHLLARTPSFNVANLAVPGTHSISH